MSQSFYKLILNLNINESHCVSLLLTLTVFGIFYYYPATEYIESFKVAINIRLRKYQAARLRKLRENIDLSYDPSNCETLDKFQQLKGKSDCIFAKRAVLWGSPNFDQSKSIDENLQDLLPSLLKFSCLIEKSDSKLDGYLIEIRGEKYSNSVTIFAAVVGKVLKFISENDPANVNCMKMKSIDQPSWYFSFNNISFFVTSFSPCYDKSHSRYMHPIEDNKTSCFILLQPEISFLRHHIDADTSITNWDEPKTFRDKIRVNFRAHGREYHIPNTTSYPVAYSIVQNTLMNETRYDGLEFWNDERFPFKE